MKRFLPFTLSFFAASSFLAAGAHAAETESPSKGPAPGDAHLRGLEIGLRPTLGSAGAASPITVAGGDAPAVFRASSAPYGLAAGAGLTLGFRFHPLFSAGLRGDVATIGADAPNDGTSGLARATQSAGLYTRVYPLALNEELRRRVDPWIGAGVTYVHDGQTFHRPERTNRGNVDASWQIDSHAIGIPIGIGLDYRVTEWLSAGPSFEYVVMNPIAGCVKASAPGVPEQRVCTDDASGKDGLVASSAGAWNAGLMLRVTPF